MPQSQPIVCIQNPAQSVVTEPIIQLKGMSDQPLLEVGYDVLNRAQMLTNQGGFISDDFYDEQLHRFTTNWFKCYDIFLAPGTNEIRIHCHYPSGHEVSLTNLFVLRLDLKTNAPIFRVNFPLGDRQISGNEVTVRGWVDDVSARVTAEVSGSGQGKTIAGKVERNGRFWLERIPLAAKTNHLKVTVTDIVGNHTATNLTLIRSDDKIVIDPVPEKQLHQIQVTVTGKISPPNRFVWVNGLPATVAADGQWTAKGVPLSKTDGVAIFDVTAAGESESPGDSISPVAQGSSEVRPLESVSVKGTYAPTRILLNATQPTYGTFRVHLTGTAGQNFVLQASTNLVDWVPILTNLDATDTFDYYDTNAALYGCRFFRTVPIH